ncbi:hypothetical protein [Zavarzinella formosa]|uniref:hypothetical protein n=1 Tax=Zavarzinella formosa TaxID=360055 RepID=UPI0003136D1D|nr:hypothetical protein [Zavarzinella formosa]
MTTTVAMFALIPVLSGTVFAATADAEISASPSLIPALSGAALAVLLTAGLALMANSVAGAIAVRRKELEQSSPPAWLAYLVETTEQPTVAETDKVIRERARQQPEASVGGLLALSVLPFLAGIGGFVWGRIDSGAMIWWPPAVGMVGACLLAAWAWKLRPQAIALGEQAAGAAAKLRKTKAAAVNAEIDNLRRQLEKASDDLKKAREPAAPIHSDPRLVPDDAPEGFGPANRNPPGNRPPAPQFESPLPKPGSWAAGTDDTDERPF